MKKISYQTRIRNLLMDGKWHHFDEIHKEVKRYVDPEAADREYRRRHDDWKKTDKADRVTAGKRRLVILALITLKRDEIIEGKGRPGDQSFRMVRDEIKVRRRRQLAAV